jgi:hypothetical protein
MKNKKNKKWNQKNMKECDKQKTSYELYIF